MKQYPSQKLEFLQCLTACFLQGFTYRESSINNPGSAFQMQAVNFRKSVFWDPSCSPAFTAMLGIRINRTAF